MAAPVQIRTGVIMCEKCVEIDKTIVRYQRVLLSIGDQVTVDRDQRVDCRSGDSKGRASPGATGISPPHLLYWRPSCFSGDSGFAARLLRFGRDTSPSNGKTTVKAGKHEMQRVKLWAARQ
jgi:hypothetical protein